MARRARLPTLALVALLSLPGCYTTLDATREGARAACASTDAGNSRYFVCPSELTQAAASEDCAARGAVLAAIESQEENDTVAAAAFQWVSTNVWLGGSRTEEGVWSWPDGSVFWRGGRSGAAETGAFTFWQPGEPNDTSSVTMEPERCLVITAEDFDWNDRSCSLSLPYVCEAPL